MSREFVLSRIIKTQKVSLILIASIILGGIAGCFLGPETKYLKPFGDIFLNLLFTTVIPLIFFSVSSAIAKTNSLNKLGRIGLYMALVFLATGLIAAIYALLVVLIFPPAQDVILPLSKNLIHTSPPVLNQISQILTVSEFTQLFSQEHILALILFSVLLGFAVAYSKEKSFAGFLRSGEVVFMRVFSLIMYYAPIGFFAYFAVLVSELGPKLMEHYLRVTVLYYGAGLLYFFIIFSAFAYCAAQMKGMRLFWGSIFLPMITSLATCSSAASIPANLVAAQKMGVSSEIYETAIPLGSLIHKDGSVIGGMFKIAFLFGLYQFDFSSLPVIFSAIGVSVLVGTVMGAIPSGGMLGELLILNLYGFPPSVLFAIAAISIIIDPLATMINVTGNTVSSMMIARLVDGRHWAD